MASVDTIAPRAVTLQVAAKLLGVSDATARRLIKSGKLHSARSKSRFIVPLQAIDAFLSGKPVA